MNWTIMVALYHVSVFNTMSQNVMSSSCETDHDYKLRVIFQSTSNANH